MKPPEFETPIFKNYFGQHQLINAVSCGPLYAASPRSAALHCGLSATIGVVVSANDVL